MCLPGQFHDVRLSEWTTVACSQHRQSKCDCSGYCIITNSSLLLQYKWKPNLERFLRKQFGKLFALKHKDVPSQESILSSNKVRSFFNKLPVYGPDNEVMVAARPMFEADVKLLLRVISTSGFNAMRLKGCLLVMHRTRMRAIDVILKAWGDVKLVDRMIRITNNKGTQGRANSWRPLADDLVGCLVELRQCIKRVTGTYPKEDEPLFLYSQTPIPHVTMGKVLQCCNICCNPATADALCATLLLITDYCVSLRCRDMQFVNSQINIPFLVLGA